MRSVRRRQQAHMPAHRGMIPIDALPGACITTKLYNDDYIHGDFFVRGRAMRHKPGWTCSENPGHMREEISSHHPAACKHKKSNADISKPAKRSCSPLEVCCSIRGSKARCGRVPAGCGYCCGTSPHPSERDQAAGDHHSKLVFQTSSTPLALHLSTLCPSTIRSSTHAGF
jgi:hypothetical protein